MVSSSVASVNQRLALDRPCSNGWHPRSLAVTLGVYNAILTSVFPSMFATPVCLDNHLFPMLIVHYTPRRLTEYAQKQAM